MINHLQAAVVAILPSKTPAPVSAEKADQPAVDETHRTATDKASFSTLASQLNESAARAAKRDAGMTHEALGQYGRNRIKDFTQETPEANSGTRAMEVPNTTDPELLDRARAASAYVARTLAGDKSAISPFEKLSREQLNLIAYDDSGSFTLNERRAAWQGVQKMDEAWRKVAIPQGQIEQIRTGKATRFYNEALSYFKSLPAIERAVDYPKDAQAILESRIKGERTLPSPSMPGLVQRQGGDRKLTLFDVIAGVVEPTKSKTDPNSPVLKKKFTPRTSPTPVSWNERWAQKDVAAARAAKPVQTVGATQPTASAATSTKATAEGEVANNSKPIIG
ncbi:hypothetical protein N5D61_09190 [Pseudomonas sp. GD03842]|uniref:hypothetical protein n=1 Tax=Pseudomonas sp. GD03842 TaxID=2975385 RepID=UPI00244AC580|nr:hypothetical protein [Pseudomonas sp. GD03842]MDH0746518.1 hypothetical protein [Pseudomonas sp. GD03842]